MRNTKGLHVILLGGTIDFGPSTFAEMETGDVDLLVPRTHSIVPRFLKHRIHYAYGDIHFSRVDLVDSRELSSEHLDKLSSQINESPFDRILVTMGILKMHEVRTFLAKACSKSGKTIGLVGSRQPLSNYQSDAGFNLGFSIAKLQTLKAGVYTFHPNEIRDSVLRTLQEVVIITTGGTFESFYSSASGQETPYKTTSIPKYFEQALGIVIDEPSFLFRQVSMKDSRNLTREDFQNLLIESNKNRYKKQIVICGTYGLPDIARRLKYIVSQGEHPSNTYLFMGAMFPEDTHLNDGWYNLGYSLGKIMFLDENVFASMHSWVTSSDNLWKQLNEGKFLLHDKDEVY